MKMKTIIISVLCIILSISVVININFYFKEQERIEPFKGNLYRSLQGAVAMLDNSLYYRDISDMNEAFACLGKAYGELMRADVVLLSHKKEITVWYDKNFYSLDFISSCLVNLKETSRPINGIMLDGIISESEVIFITRLRDDLNIVVEKLSDETFINPNIKLPLDEIKDILDEFFFKWDTFSYIGKRGQTEDKPYFATEDNPYLLLQ